MDKLGAIRAFAQVAQSQGFAAAARQLNLSPPAVTRAVSQLEESLGTRLLVRTTRSVALTESGRRFLEDATRILADLEMAEAAARGSHATPTGELRITAPMLFGRLMVLPVLARFLDTYPKLTARTLFVDRIVNLMDEGLDVGIRIGDLPDSSMIAVRCGEVRQVLVAAPGYLAKSGMPKAPEDLRGHQLVQSVAISDSKEWAFQKNKQSVIVPIEPRIRTNTNDAAIDLCAQGWGITRLLSYQVADLVSRGELELLLEEFELPPRPVHVVHHEGRMVSAKVRAFVDFAVDELRAHPWLRQSGAG